MTPSPPAGHPSGPPPDLVRRRKTKAHPLKRDAIHPDDVRRLSRSERVTYACRLIVWEGWPRKFAAEVCGVSYETVRRWLNDKGYKEDLERELEEITRVEDVEHRVIEDARGDAAEDRIQWEKALKVAQFSRRVGLPWEFQQTYFGHVQCPDCSVHHAQPGFHVELLKQWHHPDTRRFVANLPPYHAKTTVFSVWDTVYDIVKDPNSRTIVVSKTGPFAEAIVYAIQQWLSNDDLYLGAKRNLIADYGPFVGHTWKKDQFFVNGRTSSEKDPTVLGIGVGMQVYGRRADRVKNDDVATMENQRTPERVSKLVEWTDKELLSRIGKNGKAGWMGTRVMPGDMYGILTRRLGWQVMTYPCIIDNNPDNPTMLWGEHFGYDDAMSRWTEMDDADFQMVYQQVELARAGLAFKADDLARAKDMQRTTGHYSKNWTVVGGIDLAGSRKTSGYTVVLIEGIDRETDQRYLIDIHREKSMTPDRIRNTMFSFADMYPVVEYRVETNAMQEQIVQANSEIVRPLAARGVRVLPHQTQGRNKWSVDFGVESMVPLFLADPSMVSIPWMTERDRHLWTPVVDELATFPLGHLSDTVMALWFAELAARDWVKRDTSPLFTNRRVPDWVAKRRMVMRRSEGQRTLERVPISVQQRGRIDKRLGTITMTGPEHDYDEW